MTHISDKGQLNKENDKYLKLNETGHKRCFVIGHVLKR